MTNQVLVFESTAFDIVDIHQTPWLRGYQIGSALRYSDGGAAIAKLHERNADEFTDEMTRVVELQTAGGIQPVRIFSPRGCYLLGMLARTEKAKAFRVWVLDVLEGRVVPLEIRPMSINQRFAAMKLYTVQLEKLKVETNAGMREALHQLARQLASLLGVTCPALASIGREFLGTDSKQLILEEV